jgi:hypothetical protein
MEHCKRLTISPISKDIKSGSYIDYNEQLHRVRTSELTWCWDDSKYNKAKENEFFGFYFHGIRIVVHKIICVKPPSARLPSWSKNVGQGDRNVLELSEPLKEIGWTEWQLLNGPESKMGTYTTDNLEIDRPMLYEMLKNIENEFSNKQNKIIKEKCQDFDDNSLYEEEAQILMRLAKIQEIKFDKIKSLEDIKKQILLEIQELNEKVANIDKEIVK